MADLEMQEIKPEELGVDAGAFMRAKFLDDADAATTVYEQLQRAAAEIGDPAGRQKAQSVLTAHLTDWGEKIATEENMFDPDIYERYEALNEASVKGRTPRIRRTAQEELDNLRVTLAREFFESRLRAATPAPQLRVA